MLQWLDLSKLHYRGMSVNVGSLPIMRKELLMSYFLLSLFCMELVYATCVWQKQVHKINQINPVVSLCYSVVAKVK